ncbi:MAG TPA: 2-amino-4-hydroxy-6-hydroxymethyldihydropteridine diphosphokinase [Dehalococcoidia bacterium]|nr:2-amino-4-hydroxy-6-hydroxymethyldihydropteridine diphosphokinase [Dehalococcoidia bacterium]
MPEGAASSDTQPTRRLRRLPVDTRPARACDPSHVYLGLGSNQGDRRANLKRGLEFLSARAKVLAVSSLYETEPWGLKRQPLYYNAVARVATELRPRELLAFIKEIEAALGRHPGPRWGPRPLDLDILLYDGEVVAEEDLTIPHPRLAERAFALAPLAELDPDQVHPALGKTVGELLAAVGEGGVRRLEGPSWA